MLIIFAGLPGTGKSTIARELARCLDATYLRIDQIEQAITSSSLNIYPTEDAGYEVGYALAEDNLRRRTVVADSVNPIELTRDAWMQTAERAGCEALEIEVVCSDTAEHRNRVEGRASEIPGLNLPSWQDVLDRGYEPWNRDRIVIDSAGKSVEQCVDEALEQLASWRAKAAQARVHGYRVKPGMTFFLR